LEITFIRPELCALCSSKAALARRWGPERGAVVAQRLAELQALDRLADLEHLAHVDVADGEAGAAISAGDDVVIIVEATARPQGPDLENLTVLAVEERKVGE